MTQNNASLIAASLILAFGLGACSKPGPAEQAGKTVDQVASDAGKKIGETVDKVEQKMTEQGAKATQAIDDAKITAKVKAEMLDESSLKSLQIGVDTTRGVVTLTGTVNSRTNRDKAEIITAAINGVRDVNNQLAVTSGK